MADEIFERDAKMRAITGGNPNMLVPWYLMAAYLYYVCDESLLSDGAFDHLCVLMLKRWAAIEHVHKHHVHYNDLQAGSCRLADADYPARVKHAAWQLLKSPPTQMCLFDDIPNIRTHDVFD